MSEHDDQTPASCLRADGMKLAPARVRALPR